MADAIPFNWEVLPISKETITTSSSGVTGSVQEFECMDWENFKAVAYSPEGLDVVLVSGWILGYYRELGGEKSWLGFPTSSLGVVLKRAFVQRFEAGMVYSIVGVGPISVSDAIAKLVPDGCAPHEVLGFPTSEEQPIGANDPGRIQFFENGVITLRDGNDEMWMRSRSELAPVIYVDHRAGEPDFLLNIPPEPEDDGFVDD